MWKQCTVLVPDYISTTLKSSIEAIWNHRASYRRRSRPDRSIFRYFIIVTCGATGTCFWLDLLRPYFPQQWLRFVLINQHDPCQILATDIMIQPFSHQASYFTKAIAPMPLVIALVPLKCLVEIFNFLIWCHLPRRKWVGAFAPVKTKHTGMNQSRWDWRSLITYIKGTLHNWFLLTKQLLAV